MLYRNKELVTKKTDPDIFEEIEKIALSGKEYRFQSRLKIGWSKNKEGKLIKNPPRLDNVPKETTITAEDGTTETWRWVQYGSEVENVNGAVKFKGSRNIIFSEEMIYGPKDAELIWFLLNKSLKVKKGGVFLVDAEKDEIAKTEKRTLEAEVYGLIYSKQSPLSVGVAGDDVAMKKMAASFGVVGVDKKPFYQLQNELWDRIQKAESTKRKTGKGYKEFLSELNQEKTADKKANILLAIDRGVLVYKNLVWSLVMKGGAEQPIYAIPIDEDKKANEVLISFLEKDKRWYPLVVEALDPAKYDKGPDLRVSVSSLKTQQDLKPYCEKYGVPWYARKHVEIRQELREKQPEVFKE